MPEFDDLLELIHGATLTAVGRAADLGILEFASATGDGEIFLHLQCPFRILYGGDLLIASGDMGYPSTTAGPRPTDPPGGSVFDERSLMLNQAIDRIRPMVTKATVELQGLLVVEMAPAFLLQVFPDCSGRVEMWRLFARGSSVHYGFPPAVFTE
ncbi:hypothetical protein [Nonomuraea sp. NPDC003709]|uniref:hypothetical protein n=1 Tax=Nonomuraea sp. NPDC003709 TaxID=3154450 RepID=UPI0033A68B32